MKTEIDFIPGDQEKCLIYLISTYIALNYVVGTIETPKRNMDKAPHLPISITVTCENGAESGWFLTGMICGYVAGGHTNHTVKLTIEGWI